jgi:hypothetical protein
MRSPCVLHEDTFIEYFEPFRPRKARYEIWGGLGLESSGKDWETVSNIPVTYVWTVMDTDVGPWIVPGIHSVNRICFLVTRRPHNWSDFAFNAAPRTAFLTEVGLTRQLATVRRLLALAKVAAASTA